ncbi:MAG: class E sortase [Jiangellales bacterium]
MSRGDRVRGVVGVIGELLITAGLVVGLFAVYTLFWTGVETANDQNALEEQFEALSSGDVQGPPAEQDEPDETPVAAREPLPGDAFARMRIPALGESWSWIVVVGVDLDSLTRGPGHYPDSPAPGEIGNFAVAGHRATYGEPFAYLDTLEVGDEIFVERGGREYRYLVTESFITVPSDTGVLLPVPGQPGVEAQEAIITLTTCHPRWGSTERLIVHGELTGSRKVPAAQNQASGGNEGSVT